MPNKVYPNFVLENQFEDQYNSKLDLMRFCTVDSSLEMSPGMTVKINKYQCTTNNTEALGVGEGNTKTIEVTYTQTPYEVICLQNRAKFHDEEAMQDPVAIEHLLDYAAVDIFNAANDKAMAQFNGATLSVNVTKFDFDAFVDGVAAFPNNENEALEIFALVHPDNKAEIKKNLKEDLKYITDYVSTGYIGTVNGVNLYTSNLATKDTVILATKDAVTYFNKKGAEVEQVRSDANTRENVLYTRKYGVFALTNASRAVKIVKA